MVWYYLDVVRKHIENILGESQKVEEVSLPKTEYRKKTTQRQRNMNTIECQRCGKEIDKLEEFPKGLCLACYEREYEKMSDSEKKPNFIKAIKI